MLTYRYLKISRAPITSLNVPWAMLALTMPLCVSFVFLQGLLGFASGLFISSDRRTTFHCTNYIAQSTRFQSMSSSVRYIELILYFYHVLFE